MYTFRFWFEHGGGCVWSANDAAREQYGYKVNYAALPIGEALQAVLSALEEEYHTILDWNDPAAGCQWSEEQVVAFSQKAKRAYATLCAELGEDYTVIDETETCV